MKTILQGLQRLEEACVAILLLAMIGLSASDIFLRLFFDSGISWAQPVVKVLVLWLALFGALLATRSNQHIAVDVLGRLLKGRSRRVAHTVATTLAALVCGVLAFHAYRFVAGTFDYDDRFLNEIPAWWIQSIMPAAFALMSLRFAGHAVGYIAVRGYRPAGVDVEQGDAS